jgi:hypothetical protein
MVAIGLCCISFLGLFDLLRGMGAYLGVLS